MSYYNFPKRKTDASDLSKIVDKVDRALSEVVRMTAADERGECICITCGNKQHWTDMECGHYVKRRHMTTRFNLMNVGVQCTTCNCVFDGREELHAEYIDREYGPGTAESLMRLGNTEKKWSPHELEAMLKELNAEIKRLKAEKF